MYPCISEKLPPVSFSIDGGGEENENEETETVMTAELPPKPPRVLKVNYRASSISLAWKTNFQLVHRGAWTN